MRFSALLLAALAPLLTPAFAHADTITGTAAFRDLQFPNTNLTPPGPSPAAPSFSFGTLTYTDLLTLTETNSLGKNGTGTDTLNIVLTFTAPSATTETVVGTGTVKQDGSSGKDMLTVIWNPIPSVTFSDGTVLTITMANMTPSGHATSASGLLSFSVTPPLPPRRT